jgi:hypothetical protein
MNLRLALAAIGITAACALQAGAQTLNPGDILVQPENPRVNDTIRIITAPTSTCDSINSRDLTTVMSNNRITVTIPERAGGCGVPPPLSPLHVSLGQFPPGNYEVEVVRKLEDQGGRLVPAGTRTFSVQPREPSAPIHNYTDLWWNPAESGWGMNVVQHSSNAIFATWFSYDEDGTPAWYVLPEGTWSSLSTSPSSANHVFTGPLYRTSGPTGGVIDPSRVMASLVGTAQLIFGDWEFLIARLTINGRTTEKQLRRQSF